MYPFKIHFNPRLKMTAPPHPLHGGAVLTAAALHHGAPGHAPGRAPPSVSLQTNTPDINLERDIIFPAETAAVAGGGATTTVTAMREQFKVNVTTILISALLFLMVLSWFAYLQAVFYSWTNPDKVVDNIPPTAQFWYATFSTVLILCLVYAIYYFSTFSFGSR